ncbi:hypothetical protein GH714_032824 [Hevea brasiliensis]|uniref:CHY-type domain-containing protein n=1 Tax=Hevea brasiliensis TaxID=3981 RepID=A0A6A6LVI3_HEVBR|nr:hypothetical protein GH714_032824 [Hevea brasiliensis]
MEMCPIDLGKLVVGEEQDHFLEWAVGHLGLLPARRVPLSSSLKALYAMEEIKSFDSLQMVPTIQHSASKDSETKSMDLHSQQLNEECIVSEESNKMKILEVLDKGYMKYGCPHYRRRCRIRAPCCDEIFDCRHCHNESKNNINVDQKLRHDMSRHEVRQVICSLCGTEQGVQQFCTNCGVCMGRFFCETCKLFDDDTSKKQYHCDGCGICRIGGRENFFHCYKCGCCYSILLKNNHPCVEGAMHHNCPVCFEFLFESRYDVTVLPCGHTIHKNCLKEMSEHHQIFTNDTLFTVTDMLVLSARSQFVICLRNFALQQGSEVHGRILKSGFGANKSLNNNLMGMYSKYGKVEEVRQLFEKLPHKDVVSWNTMISCFVSVGMYREALHLFDEMMMGGVKPDEITMLSLVSACTKLRDLEMGKKFHVYIEDNNLQIDGSLLNCLADMYVKCGKMEEAHRLLGRCQKSEVDVVMWTTLVSGYVKANKIEEARSLFDQMAERNLISWTIMISGYAQFGRYFESLDLFRQMRAIHGLIMRYGMTFDGFLGNALLDLYAKCEKLDEACIVFEQLPCRSAVSWNSMLDGFCRSGDVDKAMSFFNSIPEKDIVSWNTMLNFYVKHVLFTESFGFFQEMQLSNVKPDNITLIGLLSSCARVGALNHGIWLHVYIKKNDIGLDSLLATALIDMYGKCGCAEIAYSFFSELTERNVFVWTAMIAAYAMEGQAHKAIDIYLEMEVMGIKPDYVTFIALLSACSHGGLVDEGYKYFNKMRTLYNINPKIQHYGCIVDLLGRIGRLEEAVKFIETMPMEPDVSIWSSLMRACGSHHNVELAEFAFKHLIEIDPINDGAFVLLSNIYANAGRWDDVSKVRRKLHDTGVRKQPGFSLIEQNGVLHKFTAGEFSNPQSAEICSMLEEIERRLIKQQLPDTSSQHSERLAVAFGLINSQGKSTIRL